MRRSDLTICLITDEVSPSLDQGLAFAREEGIGTIDLRVIDGRNVLALSRSELADAAQRVRAAGLSVSCICTPLLKWTPPGKTSRAGDVQFAFDLGERAPREVYIQAFEAAEILGARNLRVFSYLTYDGFALDDLRQPVEDLLALADRFDMKVHVENEAVCNIAGFAELEALVTSYRHPRLRALPDIANAYRKAKPPSAADLARLLPFTDILHIKDYSDAARGFVAFGEGEIPLAPLLAATLPGHESPVTLTIETHAFAEPLATTRRSVRALRRAVETFGLA
ncbi:TIM barrel protein [Bradyrhizobium sp. LHD-71]|uniref:sugar phosphate isomerase/epimerase family protein n=1 Tax=Bradyrhizobium sp. LHD-71 TaxID=3072141 RepID=UPI00280E3213|nr:TIM barrel protein [Bradyrhizobium sp. LHD-71]MDQ8732088.1 TIM barrel protein [Bradyrhizobium sp. LHD-71]